MSHTFDSMLKEATSLPWTMGARLMVELRNTVSIPEEPVMTKEASLGLLKIAKICKLAQTPEEAQRAVEQQAMVDPNVVAALDYHQAESERQALMGKIQELQMATEAAQAQAAQADQQAQAAMQQQEQLMAQAQQAKQDQINAVMESMQAKDQVLQTQVSAQQHRQQVAEYAQQMADQLKQIATTSPEEQQMQQQQAEQQQQATMQQQAQTQQAQAQADQASQQAQGQPQQAPAKKKVQKEVQEAQNAQQKAQEQSAQAEQAMAQDQAEQQQQQAMMQPKMGSARIQKIAAQMKMARLRKLAEGETPAQQITETPPPPSDEGNVDEILEKIIHHRAMLVDQGMSPADIDYYIRLIEEGEDKEAEDFAEETVASGPKAGAEPYKAEMPDKVAMFRLRKIAGLVKQAQFSGTNEGYGEGTEGSGQQGMFRYAAMGKCSGCGKMTKTSNMGKCAKCAMSKTAQGFFAGSSGLGADQGGIGAQGGMNQYASMGKMTLERRESLPTKEFAVPKRKAEKAGTTVKGESKGAYPIPDLPHARNALARVSQHGTPAERAMVRSKVYSKFPQLREGFEERHGESPTSKENIKKEEQGGVGKNASLKQAGVAGAIGGMLGGGLRGGVLGGLGGGLTGGIGGAISAGAGHRGEGFLRGALHGAGMGAAIGGGVGGIGGAISGSAAQKVIESLMHQEAGRVAAIEAAELAAIERQMETGASIVSAAPLGAAGGAGYWGYKKGKELHEKTGSVKLASSEAEEIGEALGVDWSKVDFTPADLAKGMEIEKEHHEPGVDVMAHEEVPQKTAKIALAHLKERGDYYDLLTPKVEEAPGDKVSESKEKVSFSKERAGDIAQRVRMVKEGYSVKKACRDLVETGSPVQFVKEAAAPAEISTKELAKAVGKGFLKDVGIMGGYAALGSGIGGGIEYAKMKRHEKKYGLDRPTAKEVKLKGELRSAKELSSREPSYSNKLRVKNIQYKIDMERLSREHPEKAAIRGAAWGAGAGAAFGPFTHRLIGKIIKRK